MSGKELSIVILGRKSICALIVALICLSLVCGLVGYLIGDHSEQLEKSEIKGTVYYIDNLDYNNNSILTNESYYFIDNISYPVWGYPHLILPEYPLTWPEKVITGQTGHKYECGIKVTSDGQIIENKVFINIAIGIAVWADNVTIRNCTFMYCDDEGIVLFGSNTTIENCFFYYCCDGIELQKSSHNSFINLWLFNNTHAGIDAIYHSNNNNYFFNCMVYGNYMGVYFKQSENNSFIDCCFWENQQDYVIF